MGRGSILLGEDQSVVRVVLAEGPVDLFQPSSPPHGPPFLELSSNANGPGLTIVVCSKDRRVDHRVCGSA
jgi:hypothetical protein